MAKVMPFFTEASNRICSWPLALAECIQGGILYFGKSWQKGEMVQNVSEQSVGIFHSYVI